MKILEIKRHLNKPDESYLCTLIERTNDYMLLKYVNERSSRVGGIFFDVGSTTYAYYRMGRGFVLWKMLGRDEKLKGYLFHICRDLKLKEDRVEYTDLLLDIWVDGRGQVTILDRDEVEECTAKRIIGEQDLAWIAHQERDVVENRTKIIDEFELLF